MSYRAFREGEQAFKDGKDIWSNTYSDDFCRLNFIRGYVAARKQTTIGPYCEFPRTSYDGTCIWP